MPSYMLVTNPFSGKGLSERKTGRVVEMLSDQGARVDVVRTRGPGDGERAVSQRKRDYTAIVAAGGDGTINEVVNGLAGELIPIGVIARGTANVLAHELDIPRGLRRAVGVILGGKELPIDAGMACNRRFLLMASAGFDAQVVAHAHRKRAMRFGYMSFLGPMCRTLLRARFPEVTVRMDESTMVCRHVIVANVPGYGGPFRPAPHAIYNDGEFDIVMYMKPGRWNMLRYGLLALCGSRSAKDDIIRMRCRSVKIRSHETVELQVDGDPAGELPCELEILPDSVRVIVP